MRVFLTNLLRGSGQPARINELGEVAYAASRSWYDEHAGVESSDLTTEEVESFKPYVYASYAAAVGDLTFVKTHEAVARTRTGELNISADATRGAIYIIRNPLDVAVAFSHHRDRPADSVIRTMARDEYALAAPPRGIVPQITQRLASWSTHVISWVDLEEIPVHVVRYEDMKRSPVETFTGVAQFANLSTDPDDIERAISYSDFEELRRQESEAGFRERSLRSRQFFRRGIVGSWRDELTTKQAQQVIDTHGPVMRRFGYLDAAGEVVA